MWLKPLIQSHFHRLIKGSGRLRIASTYPNEYPPAARPVGFIKRPVFPILRPLSHQHGESGVAGAAPPGYGEFGSHVR